MMNNNQKQIAGNNSQQQQATTINNYHLGITEERARTIFYELFNTQRKYLTQEAYNTALERISQFEKDLMPKISHIEGALEAFTDPGFQIQLAKAHRAAASSGREEDYKMLSELIKYKIENPHNRIIFSNISQSIEIVDKVDSSALCALAIVYTFYNLINQKSNLNELLEDFDKLLEKISYILLPTDSMWIEHLASLNLVRIGSGLEKFTSPIEYLHNKYDGFVCTGIKIDSKEHTQAMNILAESNIYLDCFVKNDFLDDYIRINTVSYSSIDKLIVYYQQDGQLIERRVNENEVKAFQEIWKLYKEDAELLKTVKKKFDTLIAQKDNITKAIDFINSIKLAFTTTVVGTTIVHCFIRQFDNTVPVFQ